MVLKRVTLPNRLPVLRAERQVTQFALATAAGISPNRYWRIENAQTEPTGVERTRLAKALGVSESDIWTQEAA